MSNINPIYSTIDTANTSYGFNGKPLPGNGYVNDSGAKVEGDVIAYEANPSSATLSTMLNDTGQYLRYLQENGASASTIVNVLDVIEGIAGSQGVSSAATASAIFTAADAGDNNNNGQSTILPLEQILGLLTSSEYPQSASSFAFKDALGGLG